MELSIATKKDQDSIILIVTGEADVSCADHLRAALDAAIAERPAELVVDLAELSYIDSTAIGALVGAAHRAADAGVDFAVDRPQRNVGRVFSLLGVADDLHVRA